MYEITFISGEVWRGGNIQNSKWNEIPNKPIKKLEYFLFNHHLVLENFNAYNHLKEKISTLDGKTLITKIYVLVKENNKVIYFEYNFKNQQIIKKESIYGCEYYGKPAGGWKQGIESIAGKISLTKI